MPSVTWVRISRSAWPVGPSSCWVLSPLPKMP